MLRLMHHESNHPLVLALQGRSKEQVRVGQRGGGVEVVWVGERERGAVAAGAVP
jgi:hypothetical protein